MDYNNKMFNPMDKDHTNCSCLCLIESNERRPAKIEKKRVPLPLKSSYYPTRTYTRIFHYGEFQNFLEKWLRIPRLGLTKLELLSRLTKACINMKKGI
jgi:hypothetical protein